MFAAVDAVSGASLGSPTHLAGLGCLDAKIHPSKDGSRALIARCDRVVVVRNGVVTQLGEHIVDAAWPG